MSRPIIITCAITGSKPRKGDTPAVPVSPEEQVESTHAAFEAGASMVHIHVRDEDERPTGDARRFAKVMEGVRRHCPGMIVQFSTSWRGCKPEDYGSALHLKPDMAAMTPGSVNLQQHVYVHAPHIIDLLAERITDLNIRPVIEVFDLAMLYNARDLINRGLLREPLYFQFLLGLDGALPARRQVLDLLVFELHDLWPEAQWAACGIGRHQQVVLDWSLSLGGHVRTGLEDNIRLSRDRLAASNAELVTLAAQRCLEYGYRPASSAEARSLLGLPAWAAEKEKT